MHEIKHYTLLELVLKLKLNMKLCTNKLQKTKTKIDLLVNDNEINVKQYYFLKETKEQSNEKVIVAQ